MVYIHTYMVYIKYCNMNATAKNNASDFFLGHSTRGTHTRRWWHVGDYLCGCSLFGRAQDGRGQWFAVLSILTQEAYNIVADFSYCLQQFSCGQICLQCSFPICGLLGFGLDWERNYSNQSGCLANPWMNTCTCASHVNTLPNGGMRDFNSCVWHQ